jgi:RNA polymerase sigma factor (sigma-70 family)
LPGSGLALWDRNSHAGTVSRGLEAPIGPSVEVSTLTHTSTIPGLRGASSLLRLQSDERLIALTRRGQHAAFEALCSRYQSRLLSFCRHMLSSREDAEDVLQEVFTAAFNAVLADEREINVRPWLYRIARNRSLNHLRRASAIGVDSMDVHFADHGLSTGDRAIRRESFRELLADVHRLPETQRTALLLREIDALSYEQIADAMETTVPSVKSLLVRARISLAEAAEARKLSCAEVRLELGEAAEGLIKTSALARRHVRDCDRCRFFKKQLKANNHALAAMLPVGPVLLIKQLLFTKLGSTASATGAHMAGGAGASVGAGAAAGAGAAGGASAAGGIFTVGAGALATKAVAGLAAAVIVSAGAVAANQAAHHHRSAPAASASVGDARGSGEPVVVSERSQPVSTGGQRLPAALATHRSGRDRAAVKVDSGRAKISVASRPPMATLTPPAKPIQPAPAATQLTQVTSETTQLPAAATGAGQASANPTPVAASPSAPPTASPATPASATGTPSSAGTATPVSGTPTPVSAEGTAPPPPSGSEPPSVGPAPSAESATTAPTVPTTTQGAQAPTHDRNAWAQVPLFRRAAADRWLSRRWGATAVSSASRR